jgi:hypothetical protein
VLEIQAADYTLKYGRELVATDSVDILPHHNEKLTYLCDLASSKA